jgi:hypothetical protein
VMWGLCVVRVAEPRRGLGHRIAELASLLLLRPAECGEPGESPGHRWPVIDVEAPAAKQPGNRGLGWACGSAGEPCGERGLLAAGRSRGRGEHL